MVMMTEQRNRKYSKTDMDRHWEKCSAMILPIR